MFVIFRGGGLDPLPPPPLDQPMTELYELQYINPFNSGGFLRHKHFDTTSTGEFRPQTGQRLDELTE